MYLVTAKYFPDGGEKKEEEEAPHLYSAQVPKELLHGKNLIAVVVGEDVFDAFSAIRVLRLPLRSAAARLARPRLQLVLFALELRRRRAPPPAGELVALAADGREPLRGDVRFTAAARAASPSRDFSHIPFWSQEPERGRRVKGQEGFTGKYRDAFPSLSHRRTSANIRRNARPEGRAQCVCICII